MGAPCRRLLTTAAALVFWLLCTRLNQVESTGSFEVRLHSFVEDGCCGKRSSSFAVFFRICVTNYQTFVEVHSRCIIGESLSRTYGEKELHALTESSAITFPFNFTWPGSFSFVIEAYSKSEANGETMLLTRFVAQRDLSAKEDWQRENLKSVAGQSLDLSYRIRCEQNYYGDRCDTLCKARDDRFGHYTCDAHDGRKICNPGWEDDYCNTAICRPGCHKINGHCQQPYECKCRHGWEGDFCDICSRYPGCEHGTCVDSWQCNCNEGWGGLFCNEDLNYCTNHHPCKNGGTCTNTGQGSYTCNCSDGFMGKNCDGLKNPCENKPCQNSGICLNPSMGNYTCQCNLGFYGPNCETSASICTNNPCQNGGSCVHAADGYECACLPGFFGHHCEKGSSSSCTMDFCQNNGTCYETTDGPSCQCSNRFTGVRCEVATCPCGENGECTQETKSYVCRCHVGYAGALCDIKIPTCYPNLCANGGTCRNLSTGYECSCRSGFVGRNCSMIGDACLSSPCRNGGLCKTDSNGFTCQCTEPYDGLYCEYSLVPLLQLTNSSDTVSNVSRQVSDNPRTEDQSQLVVILVCSLVGVAAFVGCAICVVFKCRRKKQKKQMCEAEEDELKQNERNDLQMNNKCVVPQKIVNTLDRMTTKVNNEDSLKTVNAQVSSRMLPEKNVLYMQRTLERREKSCSLGNSGCPNSQNWSPCNPSGGVFIIQDHILPLKMEECYQSRPPSLHLIDGDKVFATEV